MFMYHIHFLSVIFVFKKRSEKNGYEERFKNYYY